MATQSPCLRSRPDGSSGALQASISDKRTSRRNSQTVGARPLRHTKSDWLARLREVAHIQIVCNCGCSEPRRILRRQCLYSSSLRADPRFAHITRAQCRSADHIRSARAGAGLGKLQVVGPPRHERPVLQICRPKRVRVRDLVCCERHPAGEAAHPILPTCETTAAHCNRCSACRKKIHRQLPHFCRTPFAKLP
jgi:hypothetical protein